MKKLPISFILLAGSFFSLNLLPIKTHKLNHYQVRSIENGNWGGVYYNSPVPLPGVTAQNGLDNFILNYNAEHSPDLNCNTDPGFECMIYINDGTSMVLAVTDGDFTLAFQ